jgi:PEP-CTERM motif
MFSNGNYTTLDDPLGVNGTYATDINDASLIVGYHFGTGINREHGFLASTSAVPEPCTWAMMLMGFAGLGFVCRHSARKRSPGLDQGQEPGSTGSDQGDRRVMPVVLA